MRVLHILLTAWLHSPGALPTAPATARAAEYPPEHAAHRFETRTPSPSWALSGEASGRDRSGLECEGPETGHARMGVPATDLYCLPLFPTEAAPEASGFVRLLPPPTPFGVAVDRDGVSRYVFEVAVEGLPDPATLGPYDRYVAWITPPMISPVIRLGEMNNGVTRLGEGALNAFLFWVSAEADPGSTEGDGGVPERRGPLVMRGTSPAMVLRPHDLPYILAEMIDRGEAEEGSAPDRRNPEEDATHAGHSPLPAPSASGSVRWLPPPMHPEVAMPHGMMRLRPETEPFHPASVGAMPSAAEPRIPSARPRETVHLADGDTLLLEAGPLVRRIGSLELPGFGFNGQSPGPLIRASEGSTVHVRFRNATPLPSAVHWHGLRLENAFDGVPGVTQDPVLPGADFDYRLSLPDEGTFWYHPHLREEVMKDLGLAGNLVVTPTEEAPLYAPVDREEWLILDDHLVGPEGPVPYGRTTTIHALMGRFGNVFLVNGRSDWEFTARPGEVVRFHLTNAANTRTFNLSFGDIPLKLVAGDLGKLPRELWVESVVIAPAERWVVELRFPEEGTVTLANRVQGIDPLGARFFLEETPMGTIRVTGAPADPESAAALAHDTLHESAWVRSEMETFLESHASLPPDHTIELGLRTDGLPFPLDPLLLWEGVYRPPVEWAGTMPDMDWLATGDAVTWVLRDPDSGAENMAIDWRFRLGDRVRLRIVNDRDSLHPMQHPIHIHGQRFLVLSTNGEPNLHPTWKDTVLVPVGQVFELLVEMSNPGAWMIHCHIAEHMETGMMAIFQVDPAPSEPPSSPYGDER